MSVEIFDGPAEVAYAGAERFSASCARAVAARGRFTVALAGGSTPKAMYALLASAPFRERVDWPRVEVYFGDERMVPPDHPDSNYRMAREALLDHLPISPAHVHRIRGERPPEEAAREYQAILAALAGSGKLPHLDLVLLGMGPDGHTASLFPGTTALTEREALAVAVRVDKLQTFRVTLTAPVLSAAREVLIATVGEEKADALRLAIEGPPGSVPIQLVEAASKTWLVDRAAAAKLTRV